MNFPRTALHPVMSAFIIVTLLLYGAGASAQIAVSATTPNSAAQGTVNLNVTITGKGFKNGAKAQWFLSGTTNPGGVVVNSTAFVNSTTLTANITVSDTAILGGFDVQVMNADGRTGKGTELFAVKSALSSCKATSTIQPVAFTGTCLMSGCMDSSFGTAGMTRVDINPTDVHANHANYIATQADGKLVAVGPAGAWGVARYNTDGTLDTSFNGVGYGVYLAADNPYPAVPYAFALQSDNKIVITGTDNNLTFAIGRINPDGTPDSSFSGTGFKSMNLGTNRTTSAGRAVAIQADGKIVVSDGINGVWTILRFLSDGTLDSTFGSAGKTTINLSGSAFVISLQYVAGEQRIVLAGNTTSNTTGKDFAIARLRSNGALDATFGISGINSLDFCGGDEVINSTVWDAAGNLVVGGGLPADSSGISNLGLARFTSSGQLDSSFGTSGVIKLAVPFNGSNTTTGVLSVDASGKLVVSGGYASPTAGMSYLMTARLNPDGSPDTTFSGGAVVHSDLTIGSNVAIGIDGKYLVGSDLNTGSRGVFSVTRLLP